MTAALLRLSILTPLLLLALFACKGKKQNADSGNAESPKATAGTTAAKPGAKDTALYYQRTACFGTCPIFRLTIFGDGRAEYYGENFTDLLGRYEARPHRDEIIKIIDMAERIGYRQFDDLYDEPLIMDLPSVITQVNTDGYRKGIFDRYNAPKQLRSLYEVFDEFIANTEWKPIKE
jgi:hypothetical protein